MVYLALVCLSIGGVATFIGTAIIVIFAFKANTTKGLLALLLPFYIFYWAFFEFNDSNKKVFIALWISGLAILAAGLIAAIAV